MPGQSSLLIITPEKDDTHVKNTLHYLFNFCSLFNIELLFLSVLNSLPQDYWQMLTSVSQKGLVLETK